MAIKATFSPGSSPGAGLLSVTGDTSTTTYGQPRRGRNHSYQRRCRARRGRPRDRRQHLGDPGVRQGGNDTITLDEHNGALPAAHLFGGAGNDRSPAARATMSSSAARATTPFSAKEVMICCLAARATTL